MDPLTAFSLVCGVIQVVDFSFKTLAKCKEIHKKGSLFEHEVLRELTKQLVNVRAELDLPEANQSASSLISPDQNLLDVARQCARTADQLVEKLESLGVEGPRKRRQALWNLIKCLCEKGEIQNIQKRLDGYRNTLDTQILVSLKRRHDLESLRNDQKYQDLDEKIQYIICSLSQGAKNFEELKDVTRIENEKTRELINGKFQEQERRQAYREFRTRLLRSLWFDEIHSREEHIAEAHRKTFEWIFDRSVAAVRPRDSFITWLESGQGMYWVSGKAGSGKSTLMSFLSREKRTEEALDIWSGTKDMIMMKFYAWSAGKMMQKSVQGLLRSFLWHILHEVPDTIDLPMLSRDLTLIGSWTRRRLETTLLEVLDQLQSSYRICFFIDGLDEFDEGDDDLVTFVQTFFSSTGVKVCSSSRPHKAFEDAFGLCPKLRLQDLTKNDIHKYVTDRFRDEPQIRSMITQNEYEMNSLKSQIVARAEGFFLWVSLAVKDQIRGLKNDDSPKQMQERLASLPSEIDRMYLRMLHQIEGVHHQEASRFLQMALHRPRLSVLQHSLASYKNLEKLLLSAEKVILEPISSLCQSTRRRLTTLCAGLLEVHELSDPALKCQPVSDWSSGYDLEHMDKDLDDILPTFTLQGETTDNDDHEQQRDCLDLEPNKYDPTLDCKPGITDTNALDVESRTAVEFVHRTAIDFLKKPGRGRDFVEAHSPPDFNVQNSYIEVLLAKMKLSTTGHISSHINVDQIMDEVASAEDRTRDAQIKSCDLIDRTMAVLDFTLSDRSPIYHWCTRWGLMARKLGRAREVSCLNTTSSSRSSSRDSFHSAHGELASLDCFNTGPLESMNFFSFAASHGLSHYLQQMLKSPEGSVRPETLDCMLYCSIFSDYSYRFWDHPHYLRGLNVIPELLKQGANPNAEFFKKSIWKEFLEGLIDLRNYTMFFPGRKSVVQAIISAIFAFIDYGADVSKIWNFHINAHRGPMYELLAHIARPLIPSSHTFDVEGSALSVIQLWLYWEPELPQIRDMCIVKGAILHLRCTILYVVLHRAEEDNDSYAKQYELSEQESGEFIEMLERFMTSYKDKVREACMDLGFQTLELCTRFDENRFDPSKFFARDNFVARVSERGTSWYKPKLQSRPQTKASKAYRFSVRFGGVSRRGRIWGTPFNLKQNFYDALSLQPH